MSQILVVTGILTISDDGKAITFSGEVVGDPLPGPEPPPTTDVKDEAKSA